MGDIILGKPIAEALRAELAEGLAELGRNGESLCLAIVIAGADPASLRYASSIEARAEKAGLRVERRSLPDSVSEAELLGAIRALNADEGIDGIILQLPLPEGIDKGRAMDAIDPRKDVDGVTAVNRGLILAGREERALAPATALACVETLKAMKAETRGKRAVIVGRGDTVGRPLMAMLVSRDATVTVCHTKTADLAAECARADILVAAAGRPGIVTGAMLKPGAVVLDVGFNELEGGRIVGDVDFEAAKDIASMITPVPGGIGAVTTALILLNCLKARRLRRASA